MVRVIFRGGEVPGSFGRFAEWREGELVTKEEQEGVK